MNEKEWERRKNKRHRGNEGEIQREGDREEEGKRGHTTPNCPDCISSSQDGRCSTDPGRRAGRYQPQRRPSSLGRAGDQDPLQQLRARRLERDPSQSLAG